MNRSPRGLAVVGAVLALAAFGQSPVLADDNTTAAIQQVIQHSNDEQSQAVSTRDLSVMADTTTDDYFHDLASNIQDQLDHHVTAITLLQLSWGPITVAADGSSATATTFESWEVVSEAGTVDYDPVRNDYTLVPDNGTWKIKSDAQTLQPS